jgi:serine O-acetyltransferase
MGTLSSEDVLLKNITLLSTPSAEELEIVPQVGGPLPSIESLRKMVELVKSIVFPGFFDKHQVDDQIR